MKRGRLYRRRSTRKQISSAALATETTASISSSRAHNVVDALFYHFKKWHPHILNSHSEKLEPETHA